MDSLSYCYWCELDDLNWKKVMHPDSELSNVTDGSIEYLALLHEAASSYVEFASWYYEIELPLDTIKKIYTLTPLTDQIVKSLNVDLDLESAIEFANEIGYPIANTQA